MKAQEKEVLSLLRSGGPGAARALIAREAGVSEAMPATALIEAALRRLPECTIPETRQLVAVALTHLLLEVPPGSERNRLVDAVEDMMGRCR